MSKKRKPSASLHLPESSAPRHLAVMIRADGTVETVEVGEEITLHRLQELVGGYIETVSPRFPVSDKLVMLCDEEGKLKEKPVNDLASACAYLLAGDYLVGDVIILSVDRDDFVGLTDSQASAIRSIIPLTAKSRGYTKGVVFR